MKKYTSQYDMMTTQRVETLILKLGLPTTISMLITSLYNAADSYFVGKINTQASGATGVVLGLMAILQAVGFMFGHGSGSVISRKLGAKDVKSANKYSSTTFYTALIAAVILMIFGIVFLTPLMYLLGSTDTILPYAKTYALCILIAAPALITSCVMNNILRYEGRAFFAMIGLTTGGILNIFLDYILMMKLNLGILGAGIATAVSQHISWAILFAMFVMRKTQCSFELKYASFDMATIMEVITTGLPSLARQGLASIGTMTLNKSAGFYGDEAISAMSIVNRICMFIFSVTLGIGQGFQPVSGFNFGAKKYSRVKRGFFFTFIFGSCFLTAVSLVIFFHAGECVRFFRDDDLVVEIGTVAMKAQCISLLFIPFSVCNNMLFQSIGYKVRATILSTLRSGVCFIPLLLILSKVMGLLGIQIAQAAADILTCIICIPFCIHFFMTLPGKQ